MYEYISEYNRYSRSFLTYTEYITKLSKNKTFQIKLRSKMCSQYATVAATLDLQVRCPADMLEPVLITGGFLGGAIGPRQLRGELWMGLWPVFVGEFMLVEPLGTWKT